MTGLWTFLILLAAGVSGCAFFSSSLTGRSFVDSKLHPLVGPREAIDLEIYYVDRRIGDPLVGEGLWSTLHEVTALEPDVRAQLHQDGFRFAMSSSRPPRILQSLMRPTGFNDPTRRVLMQRYTVPSGQETLMMTSRIAEGEVLKRDTRAATQVVELQNGKGLFRLRAERIEDGWARLVITPEIRHGRNVLRPKPTDQDWTFDQSQDAVTFHDDRLAAEVNVGEILVLGLMPGGDEKVARHFFRSAEEPGTERLLLIRVADMRKVEPIRVSE
jgi:hypothetical protein